MKNCLVQGWNNDFVGVEEGRALCNARISITRADLHVSSRYKVNRRNRAASRLAFDLFRNADKLADLLPRSITSTRRICAKSVRWKFDEGKDAFESANGNSVETRCLSVRPIFSKNLYHRFSITRMRLELLATCVYITLCLLLEYDSVD